MTTAARPLPAHGTTARGYGSPGRRAGCNCPPCRTARNRHQKQIRINRELGRSPFTSPEAAQTHIRELHQTMSWITLTAATGVQYSNLIAIYHGQRTKIRRETEARILAVTAPAKGDGGQYIDVTGTMRRVRALSYVGHSYSVISKAAKTSPNRILSIANGEQPTVRRDLAERFAAAYQKLAYSPPPKNRFTSRARNVARAKGWHGPLAWDLATIDDPAVGPEIDKPYEPAAKYQRDPLRRAEIEHLHLCGESITSIAKKLGNTKKYVSDQLGAIRRERAEQEKAAKAGLEAAA